MARYFAAVVVVAAVLLGLALLLVGAFDAWTGDLREWVEGWRA